MWFLTILQQDMISEIQRNIKLEWDITITGKLHSAKREYFHMIAQYTVGEGLPVPILGTILKASQNYILLNSTAVKRNETQLGKKIFYVLRNVF